GERSPTCRRCAASRVCRSLCFLLLSRFPFVLGEDLNTNGVPQDATRRREGPGGRAHRDHPRSVEAPAGPAAQSPVNEVKWARIRFRSGVRPLARPLLTSTISSSRVPVVSRACATADPAPPAPRSTTRSPVAEARPNSREPAQHGPVRVVPHGLAVGYCHGLKRGVGRVASTDHPAPQRVGSCPYTW